MKYLEVIIIAVCILILSIMTWIGCEYIEFTFDLSAIEAGILKVVNCIMWLAIVWKMDSGLLINKSNTK